MITTLGYQRTKFSDIDIPDMGETDSERSGDEGDQMVNSVAFINSDDGAAIEYEGPFHFLRDGSSWETAIPVDSDDYAGILETTAENLSDRVGDFLVAYADGELKASGTIEAADVIDGDLLVRVDDPTRVDPSEIDLSEVDV